MAAVDDTKALRNGPGTVSDALSSFEDQAVKLPAGPAGDPPVAIAFALGWAMGDALICAQYKVFGHLVRLPEFNAPVDQWNLLVNQVISRGSHLNDHLKCIDSVFDLCAELETAGTLPVDPSSSDITTAIGAESDTVQKLHARFLTVLWSVASALAESYQLGHDMEQMCAIPVADPSAKVSASVMAHDADIHRYLTALASRLPAHAAHAVDNSLRLWSASVSAAASGKTGDNCEESPADLLRQGQRWYDVLAGEVSGKDGLRLTDYVAAADSVAGKLRQTARQVATRFKGWLVVMAIVGAGGIVLIVIGTKGTIGAGITAVLATFGLTWKGIGEFFGRATAHAEGQLWDAEIDWAIAYRFTILRHLPADRELKPRSKALNIDPPTKEHLRRYNQLRETYPDALTP